MIFPPVVLFVRTMHKIAASGGFYSRTVFVYARLPPPIVYKGTEQAHKNVCSAVIYKEIPITGAICIILVFRLTAKSKNTIITHIVQVPHILYCGAARYQYL